MGVPGWKGVGVPARGVVRPVRGEAAREYSQLRQNYQNNYFEAKVGKELPKQFPEPLSVGKLDVGSLALSDNANALQARAVSFLSLFFFENGQENLQKTRIFYPCRTPKIPGKEGKKRSKKQGIPRRGKKQGIPKKQGKEGEGNYLKFFREGQSR